MTQLKRVKIGKIETTLLLLVRKMSTLVIPSDISTFVNPFSYLNITVRKITEKSPILLHFTTFR